MWPADLCFVYPRWRLDSSLLAQWLFPLAALAVLVALWLLRKRIGRGPLVAALYFGGTLFPVIGFMNPFFMRYSFVCDHWSYLSSLAPIALCAALAVQGARWLGVTRLGGVLAAVTLALLASLTCRQSAMYRDNETLFRATLARNPSADMAHNNLGLALFRAGEVEEALVHFRKAVELRPDSAHAHNNLANALHMTGLVRDAITHYELSLKLEPANARTWNNLATLLSCSWDASVRDGKRAVECAQRACQLTGGSNPLTLGTLAAAYAEAGRFQEAVDTAQRAFELASKYSRSPSLRMPCLRNLSCIGPGNRSTSPRRIRPVSNRAELARSQSLPVSVLPKGGAGSQTCGIADIHVGRRWASQTQLRTQVRRRPAPRERDSLEKPLAGVERHELESDKWKRMHLRFAGLNLATEPSGCPEAASA